MSSWRQGLEWVEPRDERYVLAANSSVAVLLWLELDVIQNDPFHVKVGVLTQ